MTDVPEPALVAKFSDVLNDGSIPVASLSILWYLDGDGRDGVVSKFDGTQRVSVTVGDLTALIHDYLHADND